MTIATGKGATAADVLDVTLVKAIHPSETLRNSNDTTKTTDQTIYTKIKETKINAALPAVRIKFTMNGSNGGVTNYGRIYKNGTAIGTERAFVGNLGQTFSEDFTTIAQNDLIQIYAHNTTGGGDVTSIYNLRYYYSKAARYIGADQLITDLELANDVTVSMTNQDP